MWHRIDHIHIGHNHCFAAHRCHWTWARSQGCQSLTLKLWSLQPLPESLGRPLTPVEQISKSRFSHKIMNGHAWLYFHNSLPLGPWMFRRCGGQETMSLMLKPLLVLQACPQKTSRKSFMAFHSNCNHTYHTIQRGFVIYIFLLLSGFLHNWNQLLVQISIISPLGLLRLG